MIPAKQRKARKNKQQTRNRNGRIWEQDLCDAINAAPGSWARCWPKAWAGQPFDISAMVEGHSLAIECKSIVRGNLPFSALRPNEIENLSRFEDAGGTALVAVRRTDPPTQCFVPWWKIRDRILSGDRGSVTLGDQPQTLAAVWEVGLP